MNGNPMPVVEKSTHIGVQKSNKNSALLTVEENIKTGSITLFVGCNEYPSLQLKSTAISTIICNSRGSLEIIATSSSQS
jgi:hypothetical protein